MLGFANLGPLDFCEKLIRRHYSAAGTPISMKFVRLTQNDILIMKIQDMVEIETGNRIPWLVFHTGNSYMSVVD